MFKGLFLFLIGAVIGAGGLYLFGPSLHLSLGRAALNSSLELRQSGYEFTNPLLECNIGEKYFQELQPFKDSIQVIIDQEKSSGTVSDVAVYYRDLRNGPWFGINEHANFSPASLLKVPLMIDYFKRAESDPSLLSQQIVYRDALKDTPLDSAKYLPTDSDHKLGQKYTVENLIEYMIQYSDNDAKGVLGDYLDGKGLYDVFKVVGVNPPDPNKPDDSLTVTDYASFFRILYNASYLTRDFSEKALKILSGSKFERGMRAAIPPDIKIADKFGVRTISASQEQFHDCGIIYYPNRPFLLCIMTRGDNLDQLASVVEKITKDVYQEIDNQSKN